MKNILILLGVLASATSVLGQNKPKPSEMQQKGEHNSIQLEVKGATADTLVAKTKIITQQGSNQIHIESNTPADSLHKTLENVAIEQEGKNNKVAITTEGTGTKTVQIRQSGSNNKVNIIQRSNNK